VRPDPRVLPARHRPARHRPVWRLPARHRPAPGPV